MHCSPLRSTLRESGAALIIVLGVVTLLSVMVIAFLGTTSKDAEISRKGASELQVVDLLKLAKGQIETDFSQEIKAGSVEPQLSAGTLGTLSAGSASMSVYYPATPYSAVPDRSSAGMGPPPNLLKQSSDRKPFFDPGAKFDSKSVYPRALAFKPTARASSVPTQSLLEGNVSPLRWNTPALLPRLYPRSADDLTPAAVGKTGGISWEWTPPSWVYLQLNGSNPVDYSDGMNSNGPAAVVGRYAYQIYDVGGLLDLNVAGYDPTSAALKTIAPKKGNAAFADLTQIGFTVEQIKQLVAHRNAATLKEPSSSTGPLDFRDPYANFALVGKTNLGFLRVAGSSKGEALSNRAFSSRTHLKGFLSALGKSDSEKAALMEALQTLTHYSRGLEQPSFRPGFYSPTAAVGGPATASTPLSPSGAFIRPSIVPPSGRVDDTIYPISCVGDKLSPTDNRRKYFLPYEMPIGNNRGGNDAWGKISERLEERSTSTKILQDVVNPGFLEVRVKTPFKRSDGTMAVSGEALVKKRFPLERLAWITYKGPSALLPTGDPLYNAGGTNEAIYQSFGLKWDKDTSDPNSSGNYFWRYEHANPKTGKIFRLEDLVNTDTAAKLPREPDFIELLHAGIAVGSLAKSAVASHREGNSWGPEVYQHLKDRSTTFHILEIAANIMDQYDADSFPTIIKLPNPDPRKVGKSKYAPPLFTARGVEDLPYLYRFHWRGVEDKDDKPFPAATEIPEEITQNLALYAGDNFKCGTTHLMGFPELWNPHAFSSTNFDPALVPTGFRVVAASETPQGGQDANGGDLIVPANMNFVLPDATYDKGLSTNPKIGTLPTLNQPSSKEWLAFLNSNNWDPFLIQPVGFTAFNISSPAIGGGETTYTNLNLGNATFTAFHELTSNNNNAKDKMDVHFSTQFTTFQFSPTQASDGTYYQGWPFDCAITAADKYASIFVNHDAAVRFSDPLNARRNPLPNPIPLSWIGDPDSGIAPVRPTVKRAQLLPMYALPPANSPVFPYAFTSDSSFIDNAFGMAYQGAYTGAVSGGTYIFPSHPSYLAVNPQRSASDRVWNTSFYDETSSKRWQSVFPTNSYAVGCLAGLKDDATGLPLSPFQGSTTPVPYVPYDFKGRYYFAMTDQENIQRAIVKKGSSTVPRTVDFRGTELLFSLSKPDLFREPATLCKVDLPEGSGLVAGPNNFYSKLYGGQIFTQNDSKGWVGFSMGDIPTNYILALKMYESSMIAEGTYDTGELVAVLRRVRSNFSSDADRLLSVPTDLNQNVFGRTAPDPLATGSTYRMRFFRMPVNVASLKSTRFTLRLQFKEPLSSKWITYEERYIDLLSDDGARHGGAPVIGKEEYSMVSMLNALPAFAPKSRPIGWNRPLITSYDPRSSRFGSPMREGQNWQGAIRGTELRERQILNPADGPTGVGPAPELNGLFPQGAKTDRPSNAHIDRNVRGLSPQTLTASWFVPADWHRRWTWVGGIDFDLTYKSVTTGEPTAGSGYEGQQWWATGMHPVTRQYIYQKPTLNALDFGWYPRLHLPPYTSAIDGAASSSGWGTWFNPGGRKTKLSTDASLPMFNREPGTYDTTQKKYYADTLRVGSFSENVAPEAPSAADANAPYRQAYADPDDVVRRASGGLASSGGYGTGVVALALGQSNDDKSNRPIVLNRPFRSVAELGFVFRGLPWKNISFFLPETGDAALLDVFCLTEAPPFSQSVIASGSVSSGTSAVTPVPPVVAGKVNLNTRQESVLRALFSGALKDEFTQTDQLQAEAQKAASLLVARTTGVKGWQGPLTNVSDLAGKLFGKDLKGLSASDPVYTSTSYKTTTDPTRNSDITASDRVTWHFTGFSADLDSAYSNAKDKKTQRFREACIRALVDSGQTRLWNVMIDVIVQKGRIPPLKKSLDGFAVDGEKRAWIYLSIDRFTGDIVDQQIEWVSE